MRLSVENLNRQAIGLLERLAPQLPEQLVHEIQSADQTHESGIEAQRGRVAVLRMKLAGIDLPEARRLDLLADYLIPKSVWLIGGDGSGVWPLYRYDPRRTERGEPPLILDELPGKKSVEEYMRNEARFRMVEKIDAERFRRLAAAARAQSIRRVSLYEQLAHITLPSSGERVPSTNGNGQK